MTMPPESGSRDAANPPQAARIWRVMERSSGHGRFCAALCVAALALGPSHAGESWFTTARGHRVETPAIDGLDCNRMERVLAGIDASGYRKGKHHPYDKADMSLFEYEHRLAQAHFDRCGQVVMPPAPTDDEERRTGGAFNRGYD